MTITEFETYKMNNVIAYICGMAFPLFREKDFGNKKYMLASVNHQPHYVNQEEIAGHFQAINRFLRENNLNDKIDVRTNKSPLGNISAKEGFSILIETTGFTDKQVFGVLENRVREISRSTPEIKKYFIRGCFDGRGSVDTNSKLLALDINLSEENLHVLESIVASYGLELSNNSRHDGESRNFQFRIKKNSLHEFNDKIGLFSVKRSSDLQNLLKEIW